MTTQPRLKDLVDASHEELERLLGPRYRSDTLLNEATMRTWWTTWEGVGCYVIAIDGKDGTRLAVSCAVRPEFDFTLELALRLLGVDPELRVPDGSVEQADCAVEWPYWPGLGEVRIDYTEQQVFLCRYPGGDGGGREDVVEIKRVVREFQRAA